MSTLLLFAPLLLPGNLLQAGPCDTENMLWGGYPLAGPCGMDSNHLGRFLWYGKWLWGGYPLAGPCSMDSKPSPAGPCGMENGYGGVPIGQPMWDG